MKNKLIIFKRILSFVLFAALVIVMLTKYSNIMRERTGESNHITGLTAVKNVDVVFIGTSVTYTSWLPYRAWDEYGITSYDFASSGSMIGTEVGTIRYIKHRQPDAKLFVIDIRSYLKYSEDGYIPVVKTNTMSQSLDRAYTIFDCYNLIVNKSEVKSPINHLFDILVNQSRREALGDPDSWEYINNNVPSKYLGCGIISYHMAIDEPPAWSDEKDELSEFAERSLRHLLEYSKKNDIDILFTLVPYGATEDQMKVCNRAAEIIGEYDGNFINLSSSFAPYDVDYEKDFYNPRHVNVFGAEKYTHYMGQYILDNFDIESHTGDEKYAEWDGYLESAYKQEEKSKAIIESEIKRKNANTAFMAGLSDIDDFYSWYKKANLAEDLSLFMVPKGVLPEVTGDTEKIFKKLGFTEEKDYYHYISSCGEIKDTDTDTVNGSIPAQESQWTMTQINDAASIVIDGVEYSPMKEGINVVAWDDNRAEAVDIFTLVPDGKGGVLIER